MGLGDRIIAVYDLCGTDRRHVPDRGDHRHKELEMTDLERVLELIKREGITPKIGLCDAGIEISMWHFWFEFDGKGKARDYGVSRLNDGFDETFNRFREFLKEGAI